MPPFIEALAEQQNQGGIPVLFAMALVLICWAIVIPACLGWGAATLWIARSNVRLPASEPRHFWLGFTILIGLLQLWHLFLPIDWRATCFFLGTGFTCWVATGNYKAWKTIINRPVYATVLLAVGLWLANRGLDYARNGDSGLYHFATVRWINEYSIVPGLANLHDRLGFNQSYFLFVALLNAYPFFNYGYHVASSLLVVVLTAQLLNATCKVIREPQTALIADLLQCVLLPVVTLQGLSDNISSPSPDIAVFVSGIALFIALVSWLEQFFAGSTTSTAPAVLIAMGVGGCTLKLSFAAFGFATIAMVLWLIRRNQGISEFRFGDGVGWLAACAFFWAESIPSEELFSAAIPRIRLDSFPGRVIGEFLSPMLRTRPTGSIRGPALRICTGV